MDEVVRELLKQIRLLQGSQLVVSTNIELRKDGLPYSNRRQPHDQGTAVYFNLAKQRQVLACDRWNRIEDNLWAMAKHVEALRGQDRWGVGSLERAFAGYVALMEKTEASCWEVLGLPPESSESSEEAIMRAWRERAKVAHPDVEGGSVEQFAALSQAKDIALATIRSR